MEKVFRGGFRKWVSKPLPLGVDMDWLICRLGIGEVINKTEFGGGGLLAIVNGSVKESNKVVPRTTSASRKDPAIVSLSGKKKLGKGKSQAKKKEEKVKMKVQPPASLVVKSKRGQKALCPTKKIHGRGNMKKVDKKLSALRREMLRDTREEEEEEVVIIENENEEAFEEEVDAVSRLVSSNPYKKGTKRRMLNAMRRTTADDEGFPQSSAPKKLKDWKAMGAKSNPHCLLSDSKMFKDYFYWTYKKKIQQGTAQLNGCKKELSERMGLDGRNFQSFEDVCVFTNLTVMGEAFRDRSRMVRKSMPMLNPPVPDAEKIELKTIAIFLSTANPAYPIWRPNNVQQQINEDLKFAATTRRQAKRLGDYATTTPNNERRLLDNSLDFVVALTYYAGRRGEVELAVDCKIYREPEVLYNLQCLGTTTMQQLADTLHCDHGLVATSPIKNYNSPIDPDEIIKKKFPHWVLVIGDVVYSSEGEQIFYEQLTKWTESGRNLKNEFSPFKTGNINTKLRDVTIRCGYPYVFIHGRGCEHIVIFNSVRSVGKRDEHVKENYPRISSPLNLKTVFCKVENERVAMWNVADCSHLPENPMPMCTECFRAFCNNRNGRPRIPYKLYPYRQLVHEI